MGRREGFVSENSVNKYRKEGNIDQLECRYHYDSDEESIYHSHEYDMKAMPMEVTKRFAINSESSQSKRLVYEMMRRFKDKTQTYEFITKFNVVCEKTDESTISMAGNTPGEIVD